MKNKKLPAPFLKKVRDTIKYYDMLRKGDKVLVAVSGGADSVCMIAALTALKKHVGIDIVVANMDHGIRGKESEKDSEFVKDLAESAGIKCVRKKVKIRAQKGKRSLEEVAREKRYDFLLSEALKNKCNVISTGHNMDDQAETMVMRLMLGSSFSGLTGIPPVREEKGVKIIRPLIRVAKKDIRKALKGAGWKYVEDSTNTDTNILRNKVRLHIIPTLEKHNPRLKRSMVNLSDALREDYQFIREKKKCVLKGCEKCRGSIKLSDMLLQPKALRKEIFKKLFEKAGGNVKKLTYRHWMDMDLLLRSGDAGAALDLPGKVRVLRRKNEIVFKHAD